MTAMPSRTLDVAVVQAAAGLDPDANRAALHGLVPTGVDLVVLPEAFARDFGEAGSDVSPYAEPLTGAFASAVAETARERDTTVVAGMFETSADPGRPFNTLVARGPQSADYRKIHLYDSFGYRESDRLSPGGLAPVLLDVGGFRVGLMTCYDLRFPELARVLVDRGAEVLVVPAAWVAGPARSTTGAPWCAPGPSRTPSSCSPPASPLRGTPATHSSWTRSATSWPRPATTRRRCGPLSTVKSSPRRAARTRPWPTDGCSLPLTCPALILDVARVAVSR